MVLLKFNFCKREHFVSSSHIVKDVLFLECPQFSPPSSPGGFILCYLEICNEQWKVKTCIIRNIKRESFISGLTFTLYALVFGILKWGLHRTLRISLIIFFWHRDLSTLESFFFS